MLGFMRSAGIGTRHVARLSGKTPGLYMIHLDNGERSFSYWRSASAARQLADDRDALAAAISGAGIVYFSGITLAILPQAGPRHADRACPRSPGFRHLVAFDPNIRPRLWAGKDEMLSAITKAAGAASLVLPGFDDEAAHFGDASVADTIARYRNAGATDVLVKDGVKGATLAIGTDYAPRPGSSCGKSGGHDVGRRQLQWRLSRPLGGRRQPCRRGTLCGPPCLRSHRSSRRVDHPRDFGSLIGVISL